MAIVGLVSDDVEIMLISSIPGLAFAIAITYHYYQQLHLRKTMNHVLDGFLKKFLLWRVAVILALEVAACLLALHTGRSGWACAFGAAAMLSLSLGIAIRRCHPHPPK